MPIVSTDTTIIWQNHRKDLTQVDNSLIVDNSLVISICFIEFNLLKMYNFL